MAPRALYNDAGIISYAMQPDSALLSTLSAELRLMIWEYAVGYQHTEVSMNKNKLRLRASTTRIQTHITDSLCHDHHGQSTSVATSPCTAAQRTFDEFEARYRPFGGLICTCKQAYHESINILYTTNTFLFRDPWLIPSFQASLSSCHWKAIRAVIISVELKQYPRGFLANADGREGSASFSDNASWFPVHRALRTLPNLHICQIVVQDPPESSLRTGCGRNIYELMIEYITRYFIRRRCMGSINGLEVYIPFLGADKPVMWLNPYDSDERYADFLQRHLRLYGVSCKVYVGRLG